MSLIILFILIIVDLNVILLDLMQHLLLAHSTQSGMIFMAFHIKKFVHLNFK